MDIDNQALIDMYRRMLTIRHSEERTARLFAEGRLPSFVHLYVGEEATAVGVCANLTQDDYITSTHRGHGHLIAKGGDLKRMYAELYAKQTGYCKGKGGSMHIADFELGILGANGIVGAGIPIAAGAAFAAKYRGDGRVVACFFGDGASNTGAFHEGINLASIWKLPVIYVCENNQFGMGMRQEHHQNIKDVADRAGAYGFPGVVVDGNDVIAVYEAAHAAVARARRGDGPTFIECKTYRLRGHNEGDEQLYRAREEVEEWRKRDPIPRFRAKLLELGVLNDGQASQVEQEVIAQVEEAVQFAEESPWPDPEEVYEDVYTMD